MNPQAAAFLLAATAALGLYYVEQQALANGATDPLAGINDAATAMYSTLEGYFMDAAAALQTSNMQAFLMMIRYGESSTDQSAYSELYGGGQFVGFADHPRIYFPLPGGQRTSAAGAYQITATTWDDLKRSGWHFPDFSPAEQDLAACALIKRRGALADVVNGRFDIAIVKCRNEWTSLPGAAAQRYTLVTANNVLAQYGASFDPASATA